MSPFRPDFQSGAPSEALSPTESALLSESPSAPDRVGFIPEIGWRNWWVSPEGELLSPHYGAEVWPARERMEAVCRAAGDPAHPLEYSPVANCVCGIYARRDRELPLVHFALARHGGPKPPGMELAVGQVSLWGKTIEHEHGWRAEYAYPYFVRTFSPERAKLVRDRYGIDVEVQP